MYRIPVYILSLLLLLGVSGCMSNKRWLADDPCPDRCSSGGLALPGCASDGKYYTACEFEVQNCKRKLCNQPYLLWGNHYCSGRRSLKERIIRAQEPCPNRCSSSGLALPVCGSNGVSYGSYCEFAVAQCLHSCGGAKLTAVACSGK